ncbi:MAG: hypothetical protein OXJ64_13405 [Boseongicola sp.]|nr:hypothetical protein [Boseongicola sp.]
MLIAALAYVMGWSYAATYFAAFGVGLISLDIPHHFYLVYGFRVIVDHVWIVLALYAAMVLAGWWLRRRWDTIRQAVAIAAPPAVLLLFLGSYLVADLNARKAFQSQSVSSYRDYPRVAVWLQDNPTHGHADDVTARQIVIDLSNGCHRLVIDDGSKLLLISPHADFPTAQLGVVHVPINRVRMWRIAPHNRNCDAERPAASQ